MSRKLGMLAALAAIAGSLGGNDYTRNADTYTSTAPPPKKKPNESRQVRRAAEREARKRNRRK